MRKYCAILMGLLFMAAFFFVGCGESGGNGSSPWEKAAANGGDKDSGGYSGGGDLNRDIYTNLCGAYANPGSSYDLLLLYADGTYVLEQSRAFTFGDYTADENTMTFKLEGRGEWDIGSGFAYAVDEKGDPWAKVLEEILKDGDDEGTITEGEARDELKKSRSKIDDLFTEEELEEMDRQAMEELGDGGQDTTSPANYSPAVVAATYGHASAGDRQLTLYADGTYEEGYGLHYCCGLFTIEGDTIFFHEDPTQDLTALPWIGNSVTIGDKGLTLIDQEGKIWRREPKIEHDPYDAF